MHSTNVAGPEHQRSSMSPQNVTTCVHAHTCAQMRMLTPAHSTICLNNLQVLRFCVCRTSGSSWPELVSGCFRGTPDLTPHTSAHNCYAWTLVHLQVSLLRMLFMNFSLCCTCKMLVSCSTWGRQQVSSGLQMPRLLQTSSCRSTGVYSTGRRPASAVNTPCLLDLGVCAG